MENMGNMTDGGNSSSGVAHSLYSAFAGALYLFIGLSGIILNIVVTFAIMNNTELRGSFYLYAINERLSDILGLIGAGFYTGMVLIFGNDYGNLTIRLFSIFTDVGWYTKCWFLELNCFNRLLIITNKINDQEQKKYWYGGCIAVWLTYLSLGIAYLFTKQITYEICFEIFTWCYNDASSLGHFMITYNNFHNLIDGAAVLILNTTTLIRIKLSMNQIQELRTSEDTATEIKLFFQCFVLSVYHLTGAVVFVYFNTLANPPVSLFIVVHVWWLSIHVYGSIVFLIMNEAIRDSAKQLSMIRFFVWLLFRAH